MADKTAWMNGGGTAQPPESAARTCPQGHPLAMAWKECPYCKAIANADKRTPGNQAAAPNGRPGVAPTVVNAPETETPRQPARPGSAAPRRTMVDPAGSSGAFAGMAAGAGAAPRRATTQVYRSEEDARPTGQHRPSGGRKLRGVLVSFTWGDRLGQLYEIREGRNFIGSGEIQSAGNRMADVLIQDDDKMSREHTLILCQREKYAISDRESTNGTFVNGVQIGSAAEDLEHGSVIEVGTTVFQFYKVFEPVLGQAGALEPEVDEPGPEPQRPVRRGPGNEPVD